MKAMRAARNAFSLVEILTVIVILGVLMSMLFPVVMLAQTWAREKRAMMEIANIEIALKAYHAVYGQWPNQSQSTQDVCYTDNALVIAALTNNPRGMIFLHFQSSVISNGSYLDPWLHPYVISMDENDDGRIAFNREGLAMTNASVPVLHDIQFVRTDLNGNARTITLNFVVIDRAVGIFSCGSLATDLVGMTNMELCSWQTGSRTKTK